MCEDKTGKGSEAEKFDLLAFRSRGSVLVGDCHSYKSRDSEKLTLTNSSAAEADDADKVPIPPWLDLERLERAKRVAHKYFFSLMFIHFAGLVILVHVKSILAPLLWSGKSVNVTQLFHRYLDTLLHVKSWYEGNMFVRGDKARVSILTVKGMHKRVADGMNAQLVNGRDQMNISQYDMMITQVAFLGLALMYPRSMGMAMSEAEALDLVYFWRCVGWTLGMEDEYNLCTSDDLHLIRIRCRTVTDAVMIPAFLVRPIREGTMMGRGIVFAVKGFIPLLTWHSFVNYLVLTFQLKSQLAMTLYARFGLWSMRLTFFLMCWLPLLRVFHNSLLRFSLWLTQTEWRKRWITKRLDAKYSFALPAYINADNNNTGSESVLCPMMGSATATSTTHETIHTLVATPYIPLQNDITNTTNTNHVPKQQKIVEESKTSGQPVHLTPTH